jgi:hypothetical protein
MFCDKEFHSFSKTGKLLRTVVEGVLVSLRTVEHDMVVELSAGAVTHFQLTRIPCCCLIPLGTLFMY